MVKPVNEEESDHFRQSIFDSFHNNLQIRIRELFDRLNLHIDVTCEIEDGKRRLERFLKEEENF